MESTSHPRLHPPRRAPRRARSAALALFLGGVMAVANAQSTHHRSQGDPDGTDDAQETEWGLGVGVLSKQDAYRGIKRDTKVVPVLRFENQYVEFFGVGLEVKLPSVTLNERSRIKFGLTGEVDFNGYESNDAPILAGMAERKGAIWAGAKAEWQNEWIDITAGWAADASGNSKGQKFSLGLKKEWHFGDSMMVMPYATAQWLDRKYVDYYYGVRPSEADAQRAAYAGKGGVNVELGLRTVYQFNAHHSVLLDVGVTRLASQIKASPLVDRSTTNSLIFGYLYTF